jgi:hypothetical protein
VFLAHLQTLGSKRCPVANLPDGWEGRWGEGLTTAKMLICSWLEPFLVARIEFLEWTPDNRLRHPRFAGIRADKDARDVLRELSWGSSEHLALRSGDGLLLRARCHPERQLHL